MTDLQLTQSRQFPRSTYFDASNLFDYGYFSIYLKVTGSSKQLFAYLKIKIIHSYKAWEGYLKKISKCFQLAISTVRNKVTWNSWCQSKIWKKIFATTAWKWVRSTKQLADHCKWLADPKKAAHHTILLLKLPVLTYKRKLFLQPHHKTHCLKYAKERCNKH